MKNQFKYNYIKVINFVQKMVKVGILLKMVHTQSNFIIALTVQLPNRGLLTLSPSPTTLFQTCLWHTQSIPLYLNALSKI